MVTSALAQPVHNSSTKCANTKSIFTLMTLREETQLTEGHSVTLSLLSASYMVALIHHTLTAAVTSLPSLTPISWETLAATLMAATLLGCVHPTFLPSLQ